MNLALYNALRSLVQEKWPQILEAWQRDPNMPPNAAPAQKREATGARG